MDLLKHAIASRQPYSQILSMHMENASTEQQKQQGLIGSDGNTAMTFENSSGDFTTKNMTHNLNITKQDNDGNIVQSYRSVPPGIENLPMGPDVGKVIETPATYQQPSINNWFIKESSEDSAWDNLSEEERKSLYHIAPDADVKRYGVDVTVYKNARQMGNITKTPEHGMWPGHLQSRMVNPDHAKEFGYNWKEGDTTHIDSWDYGNRRWFQHSNRKGDGVETSRIWLRPDQMKNYLKYANENVKPSKGGITNMGLALKATTSTSGYNFLSNNCADANCEGLGISKLDTSEFGITTPEKTYEKIIKTNFEKLNKKGNK